MTASISCSPIPSRARRMPATCASAVIAAARRRIAISSGVLTSRISCSVARASHSRTGRPPPAPLGGAQPAEQARHRGVERRLAPERIVDLLGAPDDLGQLVVELGDGEGGVGAEVAHGAVDACPPARPGLLGGIARDGRTARRRVACPGRRRTAAPGSAKPVRYRMSLSCRNLKCVSPFRSCSGAEASTSAPEGPMRCMSWARRSAYGGAGAAGAAAGTGETGATAISMILTYDAHPR